MSKNYVVLDLETTGLDYKTEQITEIGAIKIDKNFNELERFHTLVSLEEGRELPEFITKLTGITAEDLVGQPSEEEALKDLAEFIGDSIVVAQNAPFDLSFISRGGIDPKEFYCTRLLAGYAEPELSASLKDVTKRNNITLDGHHRALNDVEATIEVFNLYYNVELKNYVMDEPSRPLKFVPKNAIIRNVRSLLIDDIYLIKLFRDLPKDSDMQLYIGQIIARTMGGSR